MSYESRKVFTYTLSLTAAPGIFREACIRLEQNGASKESELLEDVDGSLMLKYRLNGKVIRIESNVDVDAVYIDSQVDLSAVLKGMILLARKL